MKKIAYGKQVGRFVCVGAVAASCVSAGSNEPPSRNKKGDAIATARQSLPLASGSTPIEAGVHANGTARGHLPLWMPPGIGGIVADVALHYTSGIVRGVAGDGWQLQFGSTLAHCAPTIAASGEVAPLTGTAGDRLCLDGQELKLLSGTYNAPGATYATELDSFEVYRASDEAAVSPRAGEPAVAQSLVVTRRNGLTYTFTRPVITLPAGALSPTSPSWSGPSPLSYVLSRVTDRSGNALALSYITTDVAPRLDTIMYPIAATGDQPAYQVRFLYEDRPAADVRTGFLAGLATLDRQRLSEIRIEAAPAGTLIKSYQLSYEQDIATGHSKLTSLQECAETSCIAPIALQYEPVATGLSYAGELGALAASMPLIGADMNGDGQKDLLTCEGAGICTWQLRFGQTVGGYTEALPLGSMFSMPEYAAIGDFLGNGTDQLITVSYGGALPQAELLLVERATGITNSIALPSAVSQALIEMVDFVPEDRLYSSFIAADANGDGLADLAMVSAERDAAYVLVNTTQNGQVSFAAPVPLYTIGNVTDRISGLTAIDVDADRRADFLVHESTQDVTQATACDLYEPCGEKTKALRNVSRTGGLTYARLPLPEAAPYGAVAVDFSGDGCTDVLSASDDAGERRATLYVSDCAGTFVAQPLGLRLANLNKRRPVAMDYNDDSLQDLLVWTGDDDIVRPYFTGHQFDSVLIAGGASAVRAVALPQPLGTEKPDYNGHAIVADVNNDNRDDLLFYKIKAPTFFEIISGEPMYWNQSATGRANLLTTLTDSVGNVTQFSYANLDRVHAEGGIAAFPEVLTNSQRPVVNRLVRPDGIGGTFATTYQYAQEKGHKQGRGMLGFASIQTSDSRTPFVDETRTINSYPTHTLPAATVRLQTLPGGTQRIVSQQTTTYEVTSLQTGKEARYAVLPTQEVTTTYQPDDVSNTSYTSVTTSYAHADGYGNVTSKSTSTVGYGAALGPHAGAAFTTSETQTYFNAPACIGLPLSKTTTRTSPVAPTETIVSSFTVDTSRCRVEAQHDFVGMPSLQVDTHLAYDACGNVSEKRVVGRDADGAVLPARVSRFDYGARCRFVEATTSPTGEVTKTTYDPAFGLPVTIQSGQGTITQQTLDEYGRITRISHPDGTATVTRYERVIGEGQAASRVITQEMDAADALINESSVTVDRLGRELITASTKPFRQGLSTDRTTAYNALGQLQATTLPSQDPTLPARIEYTYDVFGRKTRGQLMRSDGTVARLSAYTYGPFAAIASDAKGFVGETRTNAVGQTTLLREPHPDSGAPTDVTAYLYDSSGRVVMRRNLLDQTAWSFHYDVAGHEVQRTTPNTGTVTQRYNSLGELRATTDARGQTTVYAYDTAGRLIAKQAPDGVDTWTYGVVVGDPSFGQLTQASTSGGYVETYLYDALARRIGTRTTVDGRVFASSHTYNAAGQVAQVSLPIQQGGSPVVVTRTYTNGVLTQLATASGETLWSASAFHPSGAVTTETTGAVRADHRIDEATGDLLGATVSGPNGSALQATTYTYDTRGSILAKTDAVAGLTESYTYDIADRLLTATVNGTPVNTTVYALNGNIASKQAIGAYAYGDGLHPHAVTQAGANTYAYDAAGNLINKNGIAQQFNSQNQALLLSNGTAWSEFAYDPAGNVYKQTNHRGETIYSLHGVETVVTPAGTTYRAVLETGGRLNVLLTVNDTVPGITYRTMVMDPLGTANLFVAGDGTAPVKTSFDVWGQRRDSTTWVGAAPAVEIEQARALTSEGYTGHQQLDDVALVHMGGRVYDASIARFLSADPALLTNSQSANAYAYVGNRPTRMVDPTGFTEESSNSSYDLLTGMLNPSASLSVPSWESIDWSAPTQGADMSCAAPWAIPPTTDRWMGPINDMPGTTVRVSGNWFIGKAGVAGFAGGLGAYYNTERGLGGGYLGAFFTSPWGPIGFSCGSGRGCGPTVAYSGVPYLQFQYNDAFLGENIGASVPGIGGVAFGERGYAGFIGGALWKAGESWAARHPEAPHANIGLGVGVSSAKIEDLFGTPVRAARSFMNDISTSYRNAVSDWWGRHVLGK